MARYPSFPSLYWIAYNTSLHQKPYSLIAQHPHPNISKIEMIFLQF